jgi:3-hydroxymyristoyl/3-hydroxydecanoyl-(acyl carrier protein) dehydratase
VWHAIETGFAVDHPTGAGHFPSDPIVPGALLLDEVIRIFDETGEQDEQIIVRVAKFHHPVRPGEELRLRWRSATCSLVEFECHRQSGDILVASGKIEFRRIGQ